MALAEVQPKPEDLPADHPAKARRHVRNYLLDTGLQLRLASYLVGVATLLSIGLGIMLWRAYREASQVMQLKLPAGLAETFGQALDQEDQRRMFFVVGALVLVNGFLLVAALASQGLSAQEMPGGIIRVDAPQASVLHFRKSPYESLHRLFACRLRHGRVLPAGAGRPAAR